MSQVTTKRIYSDLQSLLYTVGIHINVVAYFIIVSGDQNIMVVKYNSWYMVLDKNNYYLSVYLYLAASGSSEFAVHLLSTDDWKLDNASAGTINICE